KTLATGIKISQFLLKFGIDIRRKLFKEILEQLGGNLRFVISGAAAIDPEAIKGFNNLGISAVQGFGMTEASPVISAENDKEHALGSCGHAMLGVDLRIDNPDENGVGELIARGPNIMAGYYENEEETAKTLVDGWLHTGDLAYADDKGYVYICGRKKNVIVLKNGKNVYPEEIEVMISNLDYVEECMVFGQPRKADDPIDLAVCLKVVYNPNIMKDTYGATTPEEVEKVVREDVDKINDTMPTYKQITKIIVTDEEMIKTTTGKVKRYEETKKL
ncbi:MAG: AMP-binding protein, partial [Firmicutes bacterium]|nr:AMP-binding protein [Bacillota bacterium]